MRDFKNAMIHLSMIGGILAIAWLLKGVLIAAEVIAFNADEAIVALMARHILQGERPIFFYGQAYMGSLDAWLVAAAFKVFGETVWPVRLVQGLLYSGTILSTIWLGKLVFKSTGRGLLAACFMAVPAVNVTLYTTASLGGYGEALLLGNLIICLTLVIARNFTAKVISNSPINPSPAGYLTWLLLGLAIGTGMWVLGITLVYSLPAILYLFACFVGEKTNAEDRARFFRKWASGATAALVGSAVGLLPVWFFIWQKGYQGFLGELGGSAIAGVEGLPFISQSIQHVQNFLLLGITVILGMRPPWGVTWLVLPLMPFILIFWLVVAGDVIVKFLKRSLSAEKVLLAGVCLLLGGAFIFTSFGADPSGRYFLPLAAPMAIFAADSILGWRPALGKWVWSLPVLVLVYHLAGTIQCALATPPGITTQFNPASFVDQTKMNELIQFLDENGETRGYTNYWVAYPLAFLSGERLIFSPELPYRTDLGYTTRDNRYIPYMNEVDNSQKIAYITTRNPALDKLIRDELFAAGVDWSEKRIGDFQIFYGLSGPVRTADLGLGVNRP